MNPVDPYAQRRGPPQPRSRIKNDLNAVNARPSIKYQLRERQEAYLRERQEKQIREWAEWEQQMEEQEKLRRKQATEELQRRRTIDRTSGARQQVEYQNQTAYRNSETQRMTQERRLFALQQEIRERAFERQRDSDRWLSGKSARKVVNQARQRVAQVAEEERVRDQQLARQYLESRVRSKTSRFSELVDMMEPADEQPGPGPMRPSSYSPSDTRSAYNDNKVELRNQEYLDDYQDGYGYQEYNTDAKYDEGYDSYREVVEPTRVFYAGSEGTYATNQQQDFSSSSSDDNGETIDVQQQWVDEEDWSQNESQGQQLYNDKVEVVKPTVQYAPTSNNNVQNQDSDAPWNGLSDEYIAW